MTEVVHRPLRAPATKYTHTAINAIRADMVVPSCLVRPTDIMGASLTAPRFKA